MRVIFDFKTARFAEMHNGIDSVLIDVESSVVFRGLLFTQSWAPHQLIRSARLCAFPLRPFAHPTPSNG
jgi:hypothetical protein